MSMDLRELFKKQKKKNEEKNNKKTPVIIDDEDDFKPSVGTRTKARAREKAEGREVKRKRGRAILDSDSDGDTPKKKVKATPPKKGGRLIKGGKSPAPSVKNEIKNAADFFGGGPIKRSSYFKKSDSGDKRETQQDVVRVSESPTDEHTENESSFKESESSQLLSSTPTKKLCLVVERVATPPRGTPQKSSGVPEGVTPEKSGPEHLKEQQEKNEHVKTANSPAIKESGVRGVMKEVATRSSPRLKRERQVESSEGEVEREGGPKAKKNVRERLEKVSQAGDGENIKKQKQKRKATKAIKYLGDSEEEVEVEREQAVLTESGTAGKALSLASPSKRAAASPHKQTTPEREDYLVKQSGLTFDKEKSASPVKKRKEARQGGVTTTQSSPLSKKSVSSPAKLVSKPPTKPVTPASKPVRPVSTTPSGPPKISRGNSYRNYMNRSGPKAPGSKVVPEGEENCFEGLTFVITGVLESLEREAAADIVKKYGGKVTSSISKKTSYLVVGEEPGESKLAKAAQLGTKQIDEDGLLELLRTRPGKKSGAHGGMKKPPPSPLAKSRGSSKGGKVNSASPPRTGEVTDSGVGISLTTPTRHHVTTPVAMATPSPSTSSAVGTPTTQIATPKLEGSESLLWVDKYRPRSIKNIIGQQGDKSNAKKLLKWLQDWERNRGKGGGKKGGGWGGSGQGDGAGFRAALLSGPPGIGKTTTAVLACEETGYSYVELNASATRSKRTLHDEVATQLDCTSLDVFSTKRVGVSSGRRHALIMDEVDGMAGNEDRGGVQEVISMIKNTKIPIICICNDRQHQKIRSLANYCFDLRFHRPRVDQIRGAMMSVCYKEGVKMTPNALAEIIMASGQDIRQVLHNLSVWTATDKTLSFDDAKSTAKSAKKESKLNPFDVIKLVFMPREGVRELSLAERFELFFHDYSLAPLFVQENYASVKPLQAKDDIKHTLRLLADAADSLSDGDIVERRIRSSSHWGLLPVQALFSSVLPGQLMRGNVGRPEFPRWLGSNSSRGKNDRLLQDLQRHTRLMASCNKTEFGMDYLPFLHTRLTQPLLSEGSDGVSNVVSMMTTYDLSRDDWDSIVELNQFPGQPNTISNLPSKVKSAFTRTYNKEQHKTHYTADTVSKKSSRIASYEEQDDSPDTEPESDSGLSQDRMVKVKSTSRGTESKSTSKGAVSQNGRKGKEKAGAGHSRKKKGAK